MFDTADEQSFSTVMLGLDEKGFNLSIDKHNLGKNNTNFYT